MSKKNKDTAIRDNRRYKYGSLSVVFTLVFIAFVLVLNVFLSSLSLSGDLTVDLTKEIPEVTDVTFAQSFSEKINQ